MIPSVWMIWVLAGVLGASGVVLVLAAMWASARRLGAGAPAVGTCGGWCRGCGYSTDGLEVEVCPECGGGFVASARRVERGRRAMLVAAGVALLLGAGLGYPVGQAAQYGLAHAAPNMLLVQALRCSPSTIGAISTELRVRAEMGMLRDWERRDLVRACEGAMGRCGSAAERREVASVLARVGNDASEATVLRMLQDRDAGVRAEGVRAACAGRDKAQGKNSFVRRQLMTLAQTDRSATVRKLAVDSMRLVGQGEEGRSVLAAALGDPNDGVRRRALLGLASGVWDDGVAAAAAIAACRDSDENVRWLATWALTRVAEKQRSVVGTIANTLMMLASMAIGDEDADVRGAAMDAIRELETGRG